MFPPSIQLLFGWLTDDIGRFLFTLAGIASVINFVYTAVLYTSVRGHLLMKTRTARNPSSGSP